MELRNLSTFLAVAKTLSFSQAAQSLDYAQSTVTVQIQALEEELGVLLFDRLGRQITLTDAGRRLLLYAQKFADLEKEARTVLTTEHEPGGMLTIGAPETICTYRLPPVLRQYRQRFPGVQLMFQGYPVGELLNRVRDGAVDVGFLIDDSPPTPHLHVSHIADESLVVVAQPEHRLAGLPHIDLRQIEGETLLLTEQACSYRQMFERTLATEGIHPAAQTRMEFHSVEAIKQCVMAGLGIAILPEITVAREVARGELVTLHWPKPQLSISTRMVWHKEKWLSPALRTFIALVHEVFAVAQAA